MDRLQPLGRPRAFLLIARSTVSRWQRLALFSCLRLGHSMNEEEIVAGLLAAGVPMASTNAIVNFRMAARRRPDLLFTRAGRWYLAEVRLSRVEAGCDGVRAQPLA